jgi:hypothetical protein
VRTDRAPTTSRYLPLPPGPVWSWFLSPLPQPGRLPSSDGVSTGGGVVVGVVVGGGVVCWTGAATGVVVGVDPGGGVVVVVGGGDGDGFGVGFGFGVGVGFDGVGVGFLGEGDDGVEDAVGELSGCETKDTPGSGAPCTTVRCTTACFVGAMR